MTCNPFLLFEKIKNRLRNIYRRKIFYYQTGQHAILLDDIGLWNTHLKIGENVTLYPGCQLCGKGLIQIGDNSAIGAGTIIYASSNGGVKIGANTHIAAQCYLIDVDHSFRKGELISKQQNSVCPIEIGDDVWIAAGCKILKGSRIDNGAVVGALSLVNGHISEEGVAIGIPAREIKKRV